MGFLRKLEQKFRPLLKMATPALAAALPGGTLLLAARSALRPAMSSPQQMATIPSIGGAQRMSFLPALAGGAALGGLSRGLSRVLPGLGRTVAGGAAAGAAASFFGGGGAGGRRRRRGRGFSARDIRQTKRMLSMMKEINAACPKPRTASAGRSRARCD